MTNAPIFTDSFCDQAANIAAMAPQSPCALIDERAEYLCKAIAVALGENDEAVFDYEYADRVEPIESASRDGFWAWTSGGYSVCLPASLSHHWGTRGCPPPLQSALDAGDRSIGEAWAEEYPERPSLLECVIADDDTPAAQWREEALEYECEAWQSDDDCYFWKANVMFLSPGDVSHGSRDMETPEGPYVYVDAFLNTDLNYGRDDIGWLRAYGGNPDQTVGAFKAVYSVADFAALTDDDLDAIAAEAVKSLP